MARAHGRWRRSGGGRGGEGGRGGGLRLVERHVVAERHSLRGLGAVVGLGPVGGVVGWVMWVWAVGWLHFYLRQKRNETHPVTSKRAKHDSRYQPDRCAHARSPWARQPRTATGILSRVAWCIRCLLPLLSQPSSALLSQKGTHAVWPPFMGDPRRIDNFPFFGRGPLHGRRSRGGSERVHSAPARAPLLRRPCPY